MRQENGRVPDDWYRQSFGPLYPVLYAHRTVEAAEPEAAFAAKCIGISENDRVLDLGCGNGRHVIHLCRFAGRVVGLDYSGDLLQMARALVGNQACLVRADMRQLPVKTTFDVVTSFFTSFGYFLHPDDDLRVLCEISRVLAPGGRLFMDYLNARLVQKALVPQTDREYKGYRIRERRWIDTERRRVNKTIEASLGGEAVGKWAESVRLYDEPELREMLLRAGLQVDQVYGDYDGSSAGDDSPRLIVAVHKG